MSRIELCLYSTICMDTPYCISQICWFAKMACVQVAMNYLIANGAVVIPGAKSVGQMQRNAGTMGWRLDENEVEIIRERLVAMKK
jgi:diketogulonate reductase-like aldo/keto reductase